MAQIDTVGTYIGEIVESAISTTKNGLPQWTPRLKAVKKYIETADELAHYQLTEPGYIDYSSFNEDMVGFLVLYTDKSGSPEPTLNYEQAQLAVGWDGAAFETLNDSVGKRVLFRVEENTYQDKSRLQINWIDAENASPTKTLKALDAASIKDLNAKFLAGRKPAAKPVVAAKPAVSKPGKPAAAPVVTAPDVVSPTTSAPEPPKAAKKAPPAPAAPAADATLPTEIDQLAGWNYVNEHKGGNDDKTIEDAWLAACQEVGTANGGIDDQEKFTTAMWASVRDVVIKDLALS